VQGNIDPQWLLLPPDELEGRVRSVFARVREQPEEVRAGWICGLGHGVLQHTPETNVKLVLAIQREMFG
jgi:uroporphyrinogen decarboxylase